MLPPGWGWRGAPGGGRRVARHGSRASVEPIDDAHQLEHVVDVVVRARGHRAEGVAVAREHRLHAQAAAAHHVALGPVADHERFLGLGPQVLEDLAERRRVGLARGTLRPASTMPSIAAATASDLVFMKSVSVLSRSKTVARIKGYLLEDPMLRPRLISPLSIRTLNPQAGLLHTHAL